MKMDLIKNRKQIAQCDNAIKNLMEKKKLITNTYDYIMDKIQDNIKRDLTQLEIFLLEELLNRESERVLKSLDEQLKRREGLEKKKLNT